MADNKLNLEGSTLLTESPSHFIIRRPTGHKITVAKAGLSPETTKAIQDHFCSGGQAHMAGGGVASQIPPVQQMPLSPVPAQPTDWLTKGRALGYMPLSQQQLSYPNLGTTYLTNMPSGVVPAQNGPQGGAPGAMDPGMAADVQSMRAGMPNLQTGIQGMQNQLPGIASGIQQANSVLPGIASGMQQANASLPGITSGVQQANTQLPGIMSGVQQVNTALPGIMAGMQQANTTLPGITANTQNLLSGQSQAQNALNALQGDANQLKSVTGATQGTLTDLNAFTHQMMADRAVYAEGGEVDNSPMGLAKRTLEKLGKLVQGAAPPPGEDGNPSLAGLKTMEENPEQPEQQDLSWLEAPNHVGFSGPETPPAPEQPEQPQARAPLPPGPAALAGAAPGSFQPPTAQGTPAPQLPQAPQPQAPIQRPSLATAPISNIPRAAGGPDQMLLGQKEQELALQQQAHIQEQMAQEQAPIIAERNRQLADIQQRAWQRFNEEDQAGKQLMQDIANTKIDPTRVYGSMDTPQKVGTMIASALGGWAAGVTGFKMDNPVMKQMDLIVQRDIDAQKANLQTKESLVKLHLQRGNSLLEAEQLAKADLNDSIAGQMALVANKWGGPQAKAAAQQAIGELAQKSTMLRQQVANLRMDSAAKAVDIKLKQNQLWMAQMQRGILGGAASQMLNRQPTVQSGQPAQPGSQPGTEQDPGLVPLGPARTVFGDRAIDVGNNQARIAQTGDDAKNLKTAKARYDEAMALLTKPPDLSTFKPLEGLRQIHHWRGEMIDALTGLTPDTAARTLGEKRKMWEDRIPSVADFTKSMLTYGAWSGPLTDAMESIKGELRQYWTAEVRQRTTDPESAISSMLLGMGGGK